MTKSKEVKKNRMKIREEIWDTNTVGLADGFVQTNLVILPQKYALEFLLFCQRNPKPCPLIEVTDKGSFVPKLTTPDGDLRTDLPMYRIYKKGELVEERKNIKNYWRDDLVSFLIGCSYTFDHRLLDAGVKLPHLLSPDKYKISSFITNIRCVPSGIFRGYVVVSMRPILHYQVSKAVQITSRYPLAHGGPISIGNSHSINANYTKEEWQNLYGGTKDHVPVFWACGVTPQAVAKEAKPDFMITHKPGHMFITDLKDIEIEAV